MQLRGNITKYLAVTASLAVGFGVAFFLAPDVFDRVSQEMIAFFGILMAAVLPTMVLTANAIRSGGLSVKRISDLGGALMRQVQLWAGLFLFSLAACVAVVIGKTFAWQIGVTIPYFLHEINLAHSLNGIIAGLATLMLLRARTVFQGLISLISLSTEIAISEAKRRDQLEHQATNKIIENQPKREGFGSYTDLKH